MEPAANLTGSTTSLGLTSTKTPNPFIDTLTPSRIDIQAADEDMRTNDIALQTLTRPPVDDTTPAPLQTRITVEKPVHAFRTEIEGAKAKSDEEIKNETNIKTKKVAYVILGILAATLLIAGVAAACVFCPPAGVAILAVGITVIAAGGIGGVIYNWPDSVPESEVAEMKAAGQNLDKALGFFENYPKTATSNGNSFEEFLENECPVTYDEALQGPSYILEDLGKYTSLFEKKLQVNNKKLQIEDKEQESSALTSKIGILEEEILTLTDELGIDNDPACSREITDLENQNSVLDPDSPVVQQNNERIGKLKELQGKLEELEQIGEELDQISTEIQTLKSELTGLERDYQTSKEALATEIKAASAPPYRGVDNRQSDPRLPSWLSANIQTPDTEITINRDGKSIYTFGHLAERKYHGIHVPGNNQFPGHSLSLHEDDYRVLGRTRENDFLSNGYQAEIKIGDKSYPSVTHYMLSRKFDSIPLDDLPPAEKAKILALRREIEKSSTAEYALSLSKQMWNPETLFAGMDKELKTALFYKFVGPNGDLTKEGRALLATGDKTLYAGNERGDTSYGVQFIDGNRMKGQNKLGVYLMEIRSQLKADIERKRLAAITPQTTNVTPVVDDDDYDDELPFFDAEQGNP